MTPIDFYGQYVAGRLKKRIPDYAGSAHSKGHPQNLFERIDITAEKPIPVPVPANPANNVLEHDPVIAIGDVHTSRVLQFGVSNLITTALGAGVLIDVGFADSLRAGVAGQTAALRADVDVSAGGEFALTDRDASDAGKPLWQLLGLDTDPQVDLCLILTVKGAAPDPGSIAVEAVFWGI